MFPAHGSRHSSPGICTARTVRVKRRTHADADAFLPEAEDPGEHVCKPLFCRTALGDRRRRIPMEAEDGRFRLFDAVAMFLHNAGMRQPLMLVLDDLHSADAPSILLLRFVARDLDESRVLVLGAYRDMELDRSQWLAVAVAELSRETATRHLRLPGLSETGVGRLMQQTTGVMAWESVVAAVSRYTEGNPLFVGEVARLLAAEVRPERIGDHLDTTIHTGTFCCYTPDPQAPITWRT